MKKLLAAAKKLLLSKDESLVRQGVELALGDPALRDALLQGTTLEAATPGFHRVLPGGPLKGPSNTAGGREHAAIRLLHDAGRLPAGLRLEARTPVAPRRRKGMLEMFEDLEVPLVALSIEDLDLVPPKGLRRLEVEHSRLPQAHLLQADVLRLTLDPWSLHALQDLPAELHLRLRTSDNITVRLPGLRSLVLQRAWGLTNLEGLKHCPELRVLEIHESPNLEDVSALAQCSRLEELTLRAWGFTSLPIGRAPLRKLSLHRCSGLKELPDLRGSAGLESLDLGYCGALKALPWLPHSPAITRLELTGSGIRSLAPLSALPNLEWLALDGSKVSDLGPLRDLPALRCLDLRHSRVQSLEPLAGLTALRCVAVGGTRLKKTDAPEDIQRWVSIAASPNLQEMAARTLERKKRTRLPGASGKRAAAAGRMLKSTDAEVVQQGLELLAALDDPIVIDALLQDLTWKANGKGFMPASKRWGGRRCAFIALGLLALRPELRPDLRSVEFLRLTSRYGDANLRPFDLGTLHALPALTRLELVAVSPLLNDDPGQNPGQNGTVGLLPALQRVLIRGPVASLGFLARAPKLESVRLAAAGIVDVRGLATSGVARLDFHTAGPVDFAALAPCARLREIRVRYTKGLDYGRIGTIKSLRRLRVPKGTPLPALPGVAVTYG